jgi:flagellar hook-associated protein 1 FlgK
VSTFSGLNTATTALFAAQRAMDVTGQNVANVNTDGYSRQRVELQSVGPNGVPAIWSTSNGIGQGVNSDHITRIRDRFLEGRAQAEHAATASLTVQDSTLAQVEDAFREPGKTGLQSQLTSVWAGWGDVMNNPTDPGARSQVLQRTATLVAGLHTTSATLDQQWAQNRDSLQTLVQNVNASAASIADLNTAIRRATQSGQPSNELADKRDALVLSLSDQIGATATLMDDGTVNVAVSGTTLVSGGSSLSWQLTGSADPDDVATDPPAIVTDPGNATIRPGGTADGLLTALTSTIPRYRAQLDAVAQQLATQLNDVHTVGYDRNGDAGGPMFGDGSGTLPVDVSTITAGNLTLLITDGSKLAAAATAPSASGVVSGDNVNADKLYQLRLVANGVDTTYRKMIVSLGVEAATATNKLTTQSVISAQVDSARESVSGVSIDEEMTNMLQFQHGYQAAGRLITAIDDMLDTLINKTGLVGR